MGVIIPMHCDIAAIILYLSTVLILSRSISDHHLRSFSTGIKICLIDQCLYVKTPLSGLTTSYGVVLSV